MSCAQSSERRTGIGSGREIQTDETHPSTYTARARADTLRGRARRNGPPDQTLPGMEDRAIKPAEDGASAYAEIRDQRIELNRDECVWVREGQIVAVAHSVVHVRRTR